MTVRYDGSEIQGRTAAFGSGLKKTLLHSDFVFVHYNNDSIFFDGVMVVRDNQVFFEAGSSSALQEIKNNQRAAVPE